MRPGEQYPRRGDWTDARLLEQRRRQRSYEPLDLSLELACFLVRCSNPAGAAAQRELARRELGLLLRSRPQPGAVAEEACAAERAQLHPQRLRRHDHERAQLVESRSPYRDRSFTGDHEHTQRFSLAACTWQGGRTCERGPCRCDRVECVTLCPRAAFPTSASTSTTRSRRSPRKRASPRP